MSLPKYAVEAGLNMFLDKYRLCQQHEFEMYKSTDEFIEEFREYNIYFICQRNRVSIVHDFYSVDDKNIHLRLRVWENNGSIEIPIIIENTYGVQSISIVSEYPHSQFKLLDENNELFYYATSASYLLDMKRLNIKPEPSFLDLEVLYIGQTMRSSEVPIIDRLTDHNVLQSIYSTTRPDKEVFLLFCAFNQTGIVELKGSIQTQKKYYDEDATRLNRFFNTQLQISPKQRITVTEAALIRYFEPRHNIEYKATFPDSNKHTSYMECYLLDLNAVSIEVVTTETDFKLYSQNVLTNDHHAKTFYLQTDTERRKLFHID